MRSFPGGSPGVRRPQFHPWVGKIPLEKEMATHSSILSWTGTWWPAARGVAELDTTEPLTCTHTE